jgi:hypothetical protein
MRSTERRRRNGGGFQTEEKSLTKYRIEFGIWVESPGRFRPQAPSRPGDFHPEALTEPDLGILGSWGRP